MDFTKSITPSALNNEINAIMNNSVNEFSYQYDILLHMVDAELTVAPVKLMTLDTVRDYNNNITDELECSFLILAGTWADSVFPYINNLEISIVRRPSSNATYQAMEKYGIQTLRRYKAFVKNPIDVRKTNPITQGMDTENVNHMAILTIEAQLVSKLYLQLKTIQIGTNCVNTTVGTALKCLLSQEAKAVQGLEESDMLKGVDMVDADNQAVYENMPIPHGAFLINLPMYMQQQMYGVYSSGLNHFIQENYWYVYPKMKVARDDSQVRYLNIFIGPKEWHSYGKRTWRIEGDDVYIIAQLKSHSDDQAQAKMVNEGNGIRMPNADLENTSEKVVVEGNKAIASRSNSVSEFKTKENPIGVDFAPLQINASSANMYEQVSRLEGVDGMLYALVWQDSVPEILKPGMVCRVHYLSDGGKPMMIEGLLMKTHNYLQAQDPGVIKTWHTNTMGLFLFSKQKLDGTTA